MSTPSDTIELVLPFKPEFVSIARLTASGVANRIGFDIEAIEDIKVAISEICSKLVSIGSKSANNYRILFNISEDRLSVAFDCEDKSLNCIFIDNTDELSLSIITALMDEFDYCSSDSSYLLSISKVLEVKD